MLSSCNRAFKEWNISCDAMTQGRQTVLVRKGGIREEGGRFVIDDREFWLMPTFDHQNAELLQSEFSARLSDHTSRPAPGEIVIPGYALVHTIWIASDEETLNRLCGEMIWNREYVKQRFDYSPYDPLYVLLLRVYRPSQPIVIPACASYGGCKSWVTLDQSLSTHGLTPSISDEEFEVRYRAMEPLTASTAYLI